MTGSLGLWVIDCGMILFLFLLLFFGYYMLIMIKRIYGNYVCKKIMKYGPSYLKQNYDFFNEEVHKI